MFILSHSGTSNSVVQQNRLHRVVWGTGGGGGVVVVLGKRGGEGNYGERTGRSKRTDAFIAI